MNDSRMDEHGSRSAGRDPFQPIMDLLMGEDRDVVCHRYGLTTDQLDRLFKDYKHSRRRMALAEELVVRKIGRNEPCPCGSGRKYKKCCLPKHEEARKALSPDTLRRMEERAQKQEKLQKDVETGFDLLMEGRFHRAERKARRLLETYPHDDRLHDIVFMCDVAMGHFDDAYFRARKRWQIAGEEKEFYQENGYHKREGERRDGLVHFYSPTTWLEKLWIAQKARTYPQAGNDPKLKSLVEKLKIANDHSRFPKQQQEGFEARRRALQPVLSDLEAAGVDAVPYLLPLTYFFTWASLFVPGLLDSYGTEECIKILAELSMFRFPYFAQMCLSCLEKRGQSVVGSLARVIRENPAFDELKVGLILVLGSIPCPESFQILTGLTRHENPYIVNWAAQALGRHGNPEAVPYLEEAKKRLGGLSKIEGAIKDLIRNGHEGNRR